MHSYRHSGLAIASVLPLPEWEAFRTAIGEPDVRIVFGSGERDWSTGDASIVEGDCLRFAVSGVGGWEIEAGRVIRIFPDGGSDGDMRAFTLGSAWAVIGAQRGLAFWHGSAVARARRTVLFCGPQGAGKSTLAASLVQRGWSLLSDDLARLEPCGGSVRLHPSAGRIKLWSDAVDALDCGHRSVHRDAARPDKHHCDMTDRLMPTPQDLSAIAILCDGAYRVERLTGARAVAEAFAAAQYRPEQFDALNAWPNQTALAAEICARVPVYRLWRPRRLDALMQLPGWLDRMWE